jgi:HD-like signal output (HDOD) protein/DNA-binding NarL/FixJ family response regulator
MANILVIDGAAFWRDIAADGLRLKGYNVTTAEDISIGLTKLKRDNADLVIIETQVSGLNGLDVVEQLRATPQWKNLPIIILTSEMQKDQVIRAKQLAVVDYLLKTQFSLRDLIDRVERRLDPRSAAAVRALAEAPPVLAITTPRQLLTREQCLARASQALGSRTLSGVVSQVIASASSPRTEMSELATLVGRDPMLSARVVAAANRLENAADRRVISTLVDAVRVTGSSTIRDIASSFWVYDAMPAPDPDGYNPIRCWQHSIATARLCDRLASEEHRPVAYLLGLCHDLGEILFRSHFGTEYRQVLEAAQSTGIPLVELEKQMLGLTHGELAQSILRQPSLPDAILQPIAAFHAAVDHGAVPSGATARLLQIADAFSTGLALNSSDQTGIRPLSRSECRIATGQEDPPPVDGVLFRAEVASLTAECARMTAREQADLIQPLPIRQPLKVWLARDPAFSTFDPVAAALQPLVDLTIHNRLPNLPELIEHNAVIVLARNTTAHGLSPDDVQRCLSRSDASRHRVLYLCGKGSATSESPSITFANWPIPIPKLTAFISGPKERSAIAA